MQSKPLNPIDTALQFEPKTLSLPRVVNPQRTLTICSCVKKQIHEEKTTIQRCIISQRDKGTEAALSGTGRGGTRGHCAAFLNRRGSFIILEGFFPKKKKKRLQLPADHISVKSSCVTANRRCWRQQNAPLVNTRQRRRTLWFSLKNSASSDDEVRPHQLSITLNGGGEIELKQSHGWPQDTKRYCSWQPHSIHSSLT